MHRYERTEGAECGQTEGLLGYVLVFLLYLCTCTCTCTCTTGFYHPEYNTDNRPDRLKKALDRAMDKGWLSQVNFCSCLLLQAPASFIKSPVPDQNSPMTLSPQISGKGFTGTFRLVHPYYPGPRYRPTFCSYFLLVRAKYVQKMLRPAQK